jgi:hypothetical protein
MHRLLHLLLFDESYIFKEFDINLNPLSNFNLLDKLYLFLDALKIKLSGSILFINFEFVHIDSNRS